MEANIVFVHALAPLHAGIGQGAGVIDEPIAREKATGLPFFPGSSLKGALRTQCTDPLKAKVFGGDPSDATDHRASSVLFSDQRLLLFPVRSLAGTFAWVTSPYILRRLHRDLVDADIHTQPTDVPSVPDTACIITPKSTLSIKVDTHEMVYVEDLDLTFENSSPRGKDAERTLAAWADWLGSQIFPDSQDDFWREMLRERLCLISDNVFQYLAEYATQIMTRIQLAEDSKTVNGGGLWYEEMLPTETILSGMMMISPVTDKVTPRFSSNETLDIITDLCRNMLQLGGMATVGRGFCRVQLLNERMK